ncbi:MAG: hypothetical protein EOM14_10010 [Clostridia bacterium]|nr:hypothetical protein [Clostridia bacterium]
MAYADLEFYKTEFRGTAVPDSEIDAALEKASREVDAATRYRIQDLATWPAFTQKQVKLAVCATAEHAFGTGELESLLDVAGSYSIGDVSISAKGGADTGDDQLKAHFGLNSEALDLLMPTGLLDRRV